MTQDHGGDLGRAIDQYGGARADWIDLSTGINPIAYPVIDIPAPLWAALPEASAFRAAYDTVLSYLDADGPIIASAGAQAIIQLVPGLFQGSDIRILGPTYNEHERSFKSSNRKVATVSNPDQLAGADLAIIVNPNNPDGRCLKPAEILALRERVGALVVDESFGDVSPDLSVAKWAKSADILVLRSFGKFFGLAGIRLGFALGPDRLIDALSRSTGPWPVSGPALHLAKTAYADQEWISATRQRLAKDYQHLCQFGQNLGWRHLGGCNLFGLFETPNAKQAQALLARHHVWSRIFPYSDTWIRLGMAGPNWQWERLKKIG